jgi:pimeloyl-ACP methyl ester carboxylesterase
MKKLILSFQIVIIALTVFAQYPKGTVITDSLYSKNLENQFNENPTRAIAIYLPPGYDESTKRYPVIYFLHGFTGDERMMGYTSRLLDYAIATSRIRPFIMVIPNERTTYDGSFYSNSGVYGNWEDFTAYDLVEYVDKTYRTIPDKDSRGITGHSMGGYGAIKIAMKHPDIFCSVYGLSPGALAIVREYGPNSDTYRDFANIKTEADLSQNYFCKVIVAFAKSWSPNPDNPPFYCDVPFEYKNREIIANPEVLKKWYANMPLHMILDNLENLKKLKAIKFDWGRNSGERFTIQNMLFSQALENVGIKHFAEEYIGTHTDNIYTEDGRLPQQMLPFFNFYLDFGQE